MKQIRSSTWRLLASCFILLSLFGPALAPAAAAPARLPSLESRLPVDQLIDPGVDTPLATDPLGDMTETSLDLHRLFVATDATDFYIGFDAFILDDYSMAYGLYLDTDLVYDSGASTDPWGRAVLAETAHLPEYAIYVWHQGDGVWQDAQLIHWGGSAWTSASLVSQGGAQTFDTANDWVEYRIPRTALGSPAAFALEAFTTGGCCHAQDTTPSDPNVAYSAPDWGSDITTLSAFVAYPPPPLHLDLTFPPDGYYSGSAGLTVTGAVTPTLDVQVTTVVNSLDTYTTTLDASGAFTQPVTLGSGANALEVTAANGASSASVLRHVDFGGSHDNNVMWAPLLHDSRAPLYRTPGGPVTLGVPVTLRLRSASGDLTAAQVRLWDDRLNVQYLLDMDVAVDDGAYAWWQVTLPAGVDPTVFWYRFIVSDGSDTDYYEDDADRTLGAGMAYEDSPDRSWQLTIYDPNFTTPDWIKNAVVYQVFPDRFRDGDTANDTPAGTFFYNESGGAIYRSNGSEWNTVICDPREISTDCFGSYSKNFYGGDLPGITDQLDYLQDLGITALYLNPIFESPSNHKYDATDYALVDDNFGSLADFQTLAAEAEARGIHLILDGVFNHVSSDSKYFDRYSRWDAAGIPTTLGLNDGSGACESPASPYRSWFYFTDVTPGSGKCAGSDGSPLAANYQAWAGYDSLPKLNSSNSEVRALIWSSGSASIGPYWIDQGGLGWRLDVAGDVDPGTTGDPANDYWEGFRTAVQAVDPQTYIVGEEWGNGSPWLLGGEWDAVMNYQFSSAVLSFWRDEPFEDNDHNANSSAGILNPLSPSQLDARIHSLAERYAPEALYAMLNLLGSHDTSRALFMLDHNADLHSNALYQDPDYDWSEAIARLKGVLLLQLTLPGAPTIYYGDEVGLVGPPAYIDYGGGNAKWEDDPYNRQPYPWLDAGLGAPFYTRLQSQAEQDALYGYYQQLTAARNAHPALRTGDLQTLLVDDANHLYAYGRKLADGSDAAVVILNRAGSLAAPLTQTVTVDVSGYLPYGAAFTEVLSGDDYTVDGSGQLVVQVPGQSGAILLLDAPMPVAPPAVTDLAVTAEDAGAVSLGWSAAPGAAGYAVYRSLFFGGGYEWAADVVATVYTDTGLTDGLTYYYVVVSLDSETGLHSGYSNEVAAIPHALIDDALLSAPVEISHTIGITPTEDLFGLVKITGVTIEPGAAEGLWAQVGFGAVGSAPQDWTDWANADYNSDFGEYDVFAGQLAPEQIGDFNYLYRFSNTGGRDWVYADQSGLIDPAVTPANPGLLHVLPSADQTAPVTPQNLYLLGATAGSITFAWDANSEPDLAGYDIYRQVHVPEGPGLFVRIARVSPATAVFTDTGVTTNVTYDYFMSAFDEHFNFSTASELFTATAEPRIVTATFTVRVPDYSQGAVFVVGDIAELSSWSPAALPMTEVSPHIWSRTISIPDGTVFQYKYTRGSWDTVEAWGTITGFGNRHGSVAYGATGVQLIDDTATDWGSGPDDHKAVKDWRDPIVVSFSPAASAAPAPLDAVIQVTWSHTMTLLTADYLVTGLGGVELPGAYTYDAAAFTVTFTPAEPLQPAVTYTVLVTGQTDAGGNLQQIPLTWAFTSGGSRIQLPLIKR